MKRNLILVTCHDLGRFLGIYERDIETLELDALGEEGVVFDNNFATAPQCSPSRGSIMTGKYPHNNGLMGLAHEGYGWELNSSEKTLPNYLNEAGYETHLFGLQHESQDPESLGYQHVHGEGSGEQRAGLTTERLLSFLDDRVQKEIDGPFFASVGFFEPHRPYGLKEYDNVDPVEVTLPPFLPDRDGIREDLAGLYGMIYRVDESIGRIMDDLSETGLARETLVIFTVDHGIAMPRAKGTCYDPGVGVAQIMRGPDDFSGGQRYGELLSNVDLLPTVLDYFGIDVPEGLDGRSFYPLVKGDRSYEARDHVFFEITWHDKYNPIRAIRTEDYKYIKNFVEEPAVYLPADIYDSPSGREVRDSYYNSHRPSEELYDLNSDPLELDNLTEKPEMREIKEELADRLQGWMERTDDPLLNGPVPPTEEQRRTLKKDQFDN